MNHYRSAIRDIEFNLFEVLGVQAALGSGPFADFDEETARDILREVDRLARTDIAAGFSDANADVFYDPVKRTVSLPEQMHTAYKAYQDAEWYKLDLPVELGGQPAPPSLLWALAELVVGANPPVFLYSCHDNFAHMIFRNGTERDQAIARHMVERRWGATMVLTEPDAGSDVGAGRTKAYPQPDGTWHIEGVKRFITSGEHDLNENIIHLVLARPAGVEGVGGPGTKGLSLFIVPKFCFDLETGEPGSRNGVYATGLEHKMGIKQSSTCELTFGDGEPAVGWLLGEVHNGIAQMFQIIEHARMLVGTKAIATLSTGYLNALEYAKTRVQGADLTRGTDKTAPRVTITHHPDVRRSLLTQKAYAEALRALVLHTASVQDRIRAHMLGDSPADEQALAADQRLNDLLLPIVKGYGSEKSWVLLGTESLQTFGGSGFLADYPLEQYVRDAKIDTLYEGTTAIQGQDFFFRKIIRDQGQAYGALTGEIERSLADGHPDLGTERNKLAEALQNVHAMTATLVGFAQASQTEPTEIYRVGLNTTRLLTALGDVICGWLLLRQAEVALTALAGDVSESDRDFYTGKVAAARWFVAQTTPGIAAERARLEASTLEVMELPESAF